MIMLVVFLGFGTNMHLAKKNNPKAYISMQAIRNYSVLNFKNLLLNGTCRQVGDHQGVPTTFPPIVIPIYSSFTWTLSILEI